MIEFRSIQLSYGRRRVLDGVSFTAGDAAVTVLLGRNGSGKTSLLRAAVGARRYEGEILLDGTPLRSLSPRERALRLGYMPQTLPTPELTVRELLLCGRAPHRPLLAPATAEDCRIADAVLERTGLAPLRNEPVSALSGGERQRAYFALLLAQDPPNLILDEPTANLDTEYRRMVRDFLAEFRTAGKCVLTVMHHSREARAVADRLCLLQDGRIVFSGPPEALPPRVQEG